MGHFYALQALTQTMSYENLIFFLPALTFPISIAFNPTGGFVMGQRYMNMHTQSIL